MSLAELGKQVKDLSDHFVALSWRLDLQEQTLSLRLSEVSAVLGELRPRGLPWPPTRGGFHSRPSQPLRRGSFLFLAWCH